MAKNLSPNEMRVAIAKDVIMQAIIDGEGTVDELLIEKAMVRRKKTVARRKHKDSRAEARRARAL